MNGRRAKALRRAAYRSAGPGGRKVAYQQHFVTIHLHPHCWRAIYQRLKREARVGNTRPEATP